MIPKAWLNNYHSPKLWIILCFFLLIYLFITSYTLNQIPVGIKSIKMLDQCIAGFNSPLYSWDGTFAKELLTLIGAEGRDLNFRYTLLADLPFSLLLFPLLLTGLLHLLYKNNIFLLGFLSPLFDVGENICTLTLLSQFPAQPSWAITFGPYFTLFKFVFLFSAGVLILYKVGKKLASPFRNK